MMMVLFLLTSVVIASVAVVAVMPSLSELADTYAEME